MKQPELKERVAKMGYDTRSGTPEELAQVLEGDLKRWREVVKERNIQAE